MLAIKTKQNNMGIPLDAVKSYLVPGNQTLWYTSANLDNYRTELYRVKFLKNP